MAGFRLLLSVHAPIVMTDCAPRLDLLLHEAMCRLSGDWDAHHALPLVFDERLRVWRASQLIMAVTPADSITAVDHSRIGKLDKDIAEATRGARRIRETGGGFLPRLSKYRAYWPPYAIFYGDGDGGHCAELLALIDGIGREYSIGMGRFTVESVSDDDGEGWRQRAFPLDQSEALDGRDWQEGYEWLVPGGKPEPVARPPRLLREVLLG